MATGPGWWEADIEAAADREVDVQLAASHGMQVLSGEAVVAEGCGYAVAACKDQDQGPSLIAEVKQSKEAVLSDEVRHSCAQSQVRG